MKKLTEFRPDSERFMTDFSSEFCCAERRPPPLRRTNADLQRRVVCLADSLGFLADMEEQRPGAGDLFDAVFGSNSSKFHFVFSMFG